MASERIKDLVAAKAAGAYESHGEYESRFLLFEDGTYWFPEGYVAPHSDIGLAALFALSLLALVGLIVGIADGASWAWIFAAAVGVCVGCFYFAIRRDTRKTQEREAALACGVFLFDDAIVIREPGYDRIAKRECFEGLKLRSAFRSESKSTPYLTLVAKTGHENLDTTLRGELLELVSSWLKA